MSDDLDSTMPLKCVVISHGVGDFAKWLGEFKDLSEGEFHKDVIKAKHSMAGKCSGKDAILLQHIFPASNEDAVSKVLKFDGPPFVGGPDLIKNGVVTGPFELCQFKVRATRNHGNTEEGEPLMVVVTSHAVNDFEEWYTKAFKPASTDENLSPMGIVKTIAGQGPDTADGKPTAVVVHYAKKDSEAKIREFFTLKGPPFVGGPDLIKDGLVIPPLTLEYYASVDYTKTY